MKKTLFFNPQQLTITRDQGIFHRKKIVCLPKNFTSLKYCVKIIIKCSNLILGET